MPLETIRRAAGYADLARRARHLRRASDDRVRREARRLVVERLGKLRGLPQKLGQMLSFSHDPEMESATSDYAALQQDAEPLPWDAVEPVLTRAWSKPPDDILADIEPHARAASLGQVHRGALLDGRAVAVKVQYPGIRDAVTADLKMLGWLSLPLGGLHRGFDLAAYQREILADLEHELDYRREADAQRAFHRWADEADWLVVPEVVDALTTEHVLVASWEDGDTWQEVCRHWNDQHKRQLAARLLAFFLEGLFVRGMMQADWHPGNLRFRRRGDDVQLVLYDFGCVYRPSDEERLALARLIRASIRRDESPWPLLLKLGFDRQYLEPLAAKLPALCHVLFEPFAASYPYDMADWRLGERVGDILGNDRWNFRIAAPARLIFLMRAFHGLTHYLRGLAAPVMWRRAIKPILSRLGAELDRLDLSADDLKHHGFSDMARYLKTRVTENGHTKVELTAYAATIDHLQETLDADLRRRIDQRGINLPNLVSQIRRRGYTPGPVFELIEGTKEIRVWLE